MTDASFRLIPFTNAERAGRTAKEMGGIVAYDEFGNPSVAVDTKVAQDTDYSVKTPTDEEAARVKEIAELVRE